MEASWQASHSAMMKQLAARLGAPFDDRQLDGICEGVEVSYYANSFPPIADDPGSTWTFNTTVAAQLPKVPFSLRLRRHYEGDAAELERGELIDVQVGDAEFDEMFLVEAAPAQVVVKLLDKPTRRYLIDVHRRDGVAIETTDRTLQLRCSGRIDDVEVAHELVRVLARLVAGIEPAFREIEALAATDAMGGPYRPANGGGAPELALVHLAEVERLKAIEKKRWAPTARVLTVMKVSGTITLGGLVVMIGAPLVGGPIALGGLALLISTMLPFPWFRRY